MFWVIGIVLFVGVPIVVGCLIHAANPGVETHEFEYSPEASPSRNLVKTTQQQTLTRTHEVEVTPLKPAERSSQ